MNPGNRLLAKWLLLAIVLFPALSCTTIKEAVFPPTATPTATATPTPTPTPTRVPMAQRDLKDFALRKPDLPDGLVEIDMPDVEQVLGKLQAETTRFLKVDLETGFIAMFTGKTGIYAHMILVYTNSATAQIAFDAYQELDATKGEAADVPAIGDDSFARSVSVSTATGYVVVWIYHEVLMEIDYAGEDDIGAMEMTRLAQLIQSRLEEGY
jgi:hypothetical protein